MLTSLGLREDHRVLDIGCGSLRVGRLLIPYLRPGNYVGVEPEGWLVEQGIREELGTDLVKIKRPRFEIAGDASGLGANERFDFALAQSIFSHTGPDLLAEWLQSASRHLNEDGALLGSFVPGADAWIDGGWTYGLVTYSRTTITEIAEHAGLGFRVLDWRHPAQTWALFAKPGFDDSWIADRPHWTIFSTASSNRGKSMATRCRSVGTSSSAFQTIGIVKGEARLRRPPRLTSEGSLGSLASATVPAVARSGSVLARR